MKGVESLKEFSGETLQDNPQIVSKVDVGMMWHRRLGHMSINYLKKLQTLDESLKNVKFTDTIKDCEVCILAKMEKLPFKTTRSRAERPLQRIHSDIMGPIQPVSWPGNKNFLITFIDDY